LACIFLKFYLKFRLCFILVLLQMKELHAYIRRKMHY